MSELQNTKAYTLGQTSDDLIHYFYTLAKTERRLATLFDLSNCKRAFIYIIRDDRAFGQTFKATKAAFFLAL